jgi:hypothetical protein
MPPPQPVKVLPFSDENLRLALPPPRKPRAECATCTKLGPYVSRLERGGELQSDTIPDEVRGLREFMRLGENVSTTWVERCSECDGLFYAERSYEYLVTGSEDSESHRALTHDELVELPEVSWARVPGAELHQFADGTWSIVVEPSKQLPQRRS